MAPLFVLLHYKQLCFSHSRLLKPREQDLYVHMGSLDAPIQENADIMERILDLQRVCKVGETDALFDEVIKE